jgi:hypothetical protein
VPSDENLHELCRRPAAVYAPLPRWPRYPPPAPPPPEFCRYDDDVECSYLRRRPRALCNAAAAADPKTYTWMAEDEESARMVSDVPPVRYSEFCVGKQRSCLRSEALAVSKLSILILWVVTPCGLVGRYQHIGGHTASTFRAERYYIPTCPHAVTTRSTDIDRGIT